MFRENPSGSDAASQGIKADEFAILLDRLGRAPNKVELGIFSVMWSEHCSYKSTRRHLGKFPTKGPKVIQGPGENAGVVDIGDGQACIFKMESHNHPSYIEPRQGAGTGVGGILRDVFTMGARPVALVNALRFGDPSHPKTRSLVAGVVSGIGGYGNCVGVPTVAGETQFHKGYNGNILVNAMAVGLADTDKIFYSRGAEPGNAIFYVGSKTGRDGIHGATMASAEFSEGDEEKRPTVQVGDPFTEKLLIEACLELMATDWIQSIQDMGAAGLTSSSVEIADKGGVGVEMDMDKVPQREEGMTAYEIMLSESQERMLMVLKPGREADAKKIFDKWDLDAEVIGYTTNTGRLVLKQQGQVVCDIPVPPLSQDAPNYDRPWNPPKPAPALDISKYPEPKDYGEVLLKLMSSPDMASKRWIWEQYDRHVMGDTIDSSQSAAMPRLSGYMEPTRRWRSARTATRTMWRSRPVRGRQAGGRRGLPQSLRRRRDADRDYRQPQLRQPGKARHDGRDREGDRGHGGSVQGSGIPGRVRQRVALQRDGRRGHPANAGWWDRADREPRSHRDLEGREGRRCPCSIWRRPRQSGRVGLCTRHFGS